MTGKALADFILVEAVHGRAVFPGRPALEHYKSMGTVHGGWFARLLDSSTEAKSVLPHFV